jgi:thioredoxin:protein disulfide reductase
VMGLIAAPCTGPFLTGILTVIAKEREVALGGAALFAFSLGLGVLFFLAGAFAMKLPKGGAWMMGVKWVSGVGLAYMAFAYLRDRFEPVRSLVAHPSAAFGVVAGGLLLVGCALGLVHILAERRKSPIAHLSKRMKLASIVPAVAGAVMFVTWVNLPRAGEGGAAEISWIASETDGRARAAAENKPVIIDFGAQWCKGCRELESDTFPDARIRTESQRFVAIRVDATDMDATKPVQDKYEVVGLPTLILLDGSGKEIARFNEFVPPSVLLEAMKKVPASSNAIGMR